MSSSAPAESSLIKRLSAREEINFLLTNYLPRRWATRIVGHLSASENPVVYPICLALWRLFGTAPDLSEAARSDFKSLKDLFTRELRDGARSFDRSASGLASPSDGIVGAMGRIEHGTLLQIKGQPYSLTELLQNATLARRYEGGHYLTLRLTAAMYHRFHAPAALRLDRVDFIEGDCWNVNPAALKRVPRLYCRNARAVLRLTLNDRGQTMLMIPVAAILVSGIRLHCLSESFSQSRLQRRCHAPDLALQRGAQIGYFEHGSTIVLITLPGLVPDSALRSGDTVRAGDALFEPACSHPQEAIYAVS